MSRLLFLVGALAVSALATEIENPGFFLKVTKNVPRIGRRSDGQPVNDFDNFFLKASKSVPRIGRRSQMTDWPSNEHSWIRKIRNDNSATQSYNYVQPFDTRFLFDLLADENSVDSAALKFISWKDFDKAIESDTQLFMKLTELGKEHRAEQYHDMHEEEPMIQTLDSGPNRYGPIFYRTERSNRGPAAGDQSQPEHLIDSVH